MSSFQQRMGTELCCLVLQSVFFFFVTYQQPAGHKALSKAVQMQLKKAKHQGSVAKQRDIKKGSHSAFQHYLEIKPYRGHTCC